MKKKAIWENHVLSVHDNLVLKDDGTVFAMFEVPASIISMMDNKGKEAHKQATQAVITSLYENLGFEILVKPLSKDLLKSYEILLKDCDPRTREFGEYLLEQSYSELINELGNLHHYKFFLTVPLSDFSFSGDLRKMMKEGWQRFRKSVVNLIRRELEFNLNWYESYKQTASDLEMNLNLLQAHPLKREETLLYNSLNYLRGIEVNKDEVLADVKNAIENMDDTTIDVRSDGLLEIHHPQGSSLLKFLPLADYPEVVNNIHLIEHLQTLPFPVEFRIKARFRKNKGALGMEATAERNRDRIGTELSEADEKGNVTKSSSVGAYMILEDIISGVDNGEYFLDFLPVFAITGSTPEEINYYKKMLMTAMEGLGVKIVPSQWDQPYLFYKMRSTEELTRSDRYWVQNMKVSAFVENLFFVSQKVGSDIGFYFGRVDHTTLNWAGNYEKAIASSPTPFFWNMFQANKEDIEGKLGDSPHVGIFGDTGSGKSFFAKLAFVYHSILKGLSLYIDPKDEMKSQFLYVRDKLESYLPEMEEKIADLVALIEDDDILERRIRNLEFAYHKPLIDYINHIHFVSLNTKDKKNIGALDPIVFLESEQAKELSTQVTEGLIGTKLTEDDRFENSFNYHLQQVIERRAKGETVGLLNVFKEMAKSKEELIKDRSENILSKISGTMLELVFSEGKNPSVSMDDHITVLGVTGLNLAKSGEVKTAQNKMSDIIMYALGDFCRFFGARNRDQETVIFLDEGWFFNTTDIGKGILMRMKRVGRSENNFLALITQSVKDGSSDEDDTAFGTIFAFKETGNTKAVLQAFGLPDDDEDVITWYENQTKGQALAKDPFGRIGRVVIHGQNSALNECFKTSFSEMESAKAVA
ncbi:conjugal transfer protein [Lactococcus cremoris subsp. cremoris IBB477]|uniref:Conjugal transfer protein n=1 Tax=Lactococcus cremoris subsp. cremoris IBB477 TaxID=1449093 RepID=A0A1E7G1S9_LACLC|nr:ATP-binding protein [Lactococcus cremoris]OEU38732.1 conjugal transfer protein [Lactococcus cremoris subsp. cremoris IBB477]